MVLPYPLPRTNPPSHGGQFMKEKVEGWPYEGFPQTLDVSNAKATTDIKNKIWNKLRLLLRGMFSVEVKPKELGNGLIIEIQEFIAKKKRTVSFSNKTIAMIDVTLTSEKSLFVFEIMDNILAETRNVDVANLQAAVEVAFDTILVRCADPLQK